MLLLPATTNIFRCVVLLTVLIAFCIYSCMKTAPKHLKENDKTDEISQKISPQPTKTTTAASSRSLQTNELAVFLRGGESIVSGSIIASNGFQLEQELNGNLIVCGVETSGACSSPVWQSNYQGEIRNDYSTRMQKSDGHLVTRQGGSTVVWSTGETSTDDDSDDYFFLAYNGTRLAVYRGTPNNPGSVLWSSSSSSSSNNVPAPAAPSRPLQPSSPPPQQPQKNKSNLMLLAYYYPWYFRNRWSRHSYPDEPLLGQYGTNEVAVAETHNAWAIRGGIDAWVVSWGGANELRARHLRSGMLRAKNLNQIKFCILYESKILPTRNFADARALNALIRDLKLIRDEYFGHPQYLRVNGRPVVVLYITRSYTNFQPNMVDTIKAQLGVDVLIIADEPYHSSQSSPRRAVNGIKNGKPVFETYTTYNMYSSKLVRPGQTATNFMLRHATGVFENWSRETIFFPNIMPQYEDFRPGHGALGGNAADFREQMEKFACLPRPPGYTEGSFPDMMFVTTFNEWWEGSTVEPDDSDRYGFTFLDELRDFKDLGPNCQ